LVLEAKIFSDNLFVEINWLLRKNGLPTSAGKMTANRREVT